MGDGMAAGGASRVDPVGTDSHALPEDGGRRDTRRLG